MFWIILIFIVVCYCVGRSKRIKQEEIDNQIQIDKTILHKAKSICDIIAKKEGAYVGNIDEYTGYSKPLYLNCKSNSFATVEEICFASRKESSLSFSGNYIAVFDIVDVVSLDTPVKYIKLGSGIDKYIIDTNIRQTVTVYLDMAFKYNSLSELKRIVPGNRIGFIGEVRCFSTNRYEIDCIAVVSRDNGILSSAMELS